MKLFNEKTINDYLEERLSKSENSISKLKKERLKQDHLESAIQDVFEKNKIICPEIFKDEITAEFIDTEIPLEQITHGLNFERNKKVKVERVKYAIPFEGDLKIFSCRPNTPHNLFCEADISNKILIIKSTNTCKLQGN